MPTPIEILLDPISLGVLTLYGLFMLWEGLRPARALPKIRGWHLRALGSFVAYFYLSSYLPLIWDKYLAQYQIVDLSGVGVVPGAIVGLLVYNAVLYAWHRAMHNTGWLWKSLHQMHHSAERIDTYGAFFFSPLDMIGLTFIGSLSLSLVVGLSPDAVTVFLFASMFMGIFQHANIRTPQWIGYVIQRPESHTIHHGRGLHRYNYADMPIFDILFGTFRNPKTYEMKTGFYDGASSRIVDMLTFHDVSQPEPGNSAQTRQAA